MYAVGKVFYTVTGPFHPFGGAVDIVVVQQQDGSFKSSPWYVKFGKFQGVLKTREKVVNIAVNGVEAGFHMYLDSNGEAHFLRDADSNVEEGDFLVSPASSGDEREAPLQDARLRKSKSTSCDTSTMETNVGDGKILTKTISKRSTILERMFGRKSIKNNHHAVDRVSSMERAEIAADLLDTKWSTNLSHGSKACSSNGEPSSSHLGKTTKMVLPDCSFDHDKMMGRNHDNVDNNFGSQHRGRSLGDDSEHCIQITGAMEDVVQINRPKTGDLTDGITLATDQSGSGSLLNDLHTEKSSNESIGTQGELQANSENITGGELVPKEAFSHGIFEIHSIETDNTSGENEAILQLASVDSDGVGQHFTHTNSPTYSSRNLSSETHVVFDGVTSATDLLRSKSLPNDLGTDKGVNQSIGTQADMQGSSKDFTGREMHEKEVLSHGMFEIRAIETDITNGKNELISHFNTVDSDGVDQNFTCTNSSPYIGTATYLPSEGCDISVVASGQEACQEKVVILSSLETVESSYDMSNNLVDKICDDVGISLVDSLQCEERSRVSCEKIEVTFEERQLTYHGASSNKEGMHNLDVQDKEVSVFEDHSSQISKANVSHKDTSVDTIANDHSTHSAHDLASQHDLVLDASSSVVEILSYMHEDPDNVIKCSTVETKAGNGELDVSVIQTSLIEDETTECIARSTNLPNNVEPEASPVISEFFSLIKVEVENTKLEDDKNRYSSPNGVEIGVVAEDPRDETEAVISFSESVEDIQFQFSDTGNFADRKTADDAIANKVISAEVNNESDGEAEEKGGNEAYLENKLETCSDLSRPETCLIPIPRSELHSDDNNLEVKSLPNLRSHINDLERSDSFQISCSLQYNGENNGIDPVLEQKPEGTGDSKQSSGLPELINKPLPDYKHTDEPRIDSFSPFVELSLSRHLLSEGMGADAACKAFDAEKVTLEKFRSMKESLIRNDKLVVRIAGRYFPWHVAAPVVLGLVSFPEEQVFEPQGMIKVERVKPNTSQGGSWTRFWPISFRRTSTINIVQPVCDDTVEPCLPIPVKELEKAKNKTERMEKKVRSLTPTSEELASLNLREGKNVVTFIFSTAMLGRQQVDANIYLWKWNTRIVISDVDGTITKSDVLGQFMPMVGVDWSQNGVAHLFSAIKENGYQLLFLSARSISQAYLTRQFLFNLKQDGKALPDGPVVISPDGLFPSLYREVIRRAPHEFKISCLEAIKALFPPDSHPFYAGFGNRDTDEFSYLKVGIPMGKIFIVNPKGEVAVNRRVDTKSYTSLHPLVNRMFPLISSSTEQEAYNNYNFWKIPLLTVD